MILREAAAAAEKVSIDEIIHRLMDRYTSLWWRCDTGLPDLGRGYSLREQYGKEKELEKHIQALIARIKRRPQGQDERLALQEQTGQTLILLAKSLLGLEDREIEAIRSYRFAEIVLEFSRMAKDFDPGISAEDIYQASRNVWSMNFMQLLAGLPVELTPAIFAYSMLYPYSDNYLDDPAIPIETKIAFNRRFRRRLAGEDIPVENRHEEIISDLIGMIEGQFDRSLFPQVYESLLAIHSAQARSLSLLQGDASPYEVDVLGLCFEKGGVSVLADGYLVAGSLSPAQQEFMFFYGAFTQLMDDLEDVQSDLDQGRLTIFSQTARRWPLDAITNRMFHFGHLLLDTLEGMDVPGSEPFMAVLRKSIDPLLIASAGELGRFYSRPYLRTLEAHIPVRFSFLRKQRKKFARMQASMMDLVEAFAVSDLG